MFYAHVEIPTSKINQKDYSAADGRRVSTAEESCGRVELQR